MRVHHVPCELLPAEIASGIRAGDEAAHLALYDLCLSTAGYFRRSVTPAIDPQDRTHDVYLAVVSGIRAGRLLDDAQLVNYLWGTAKFLRWKDIRERMTRREFRLWPAIIWPRDSQLPSLAWLRLVEREILLRSFIDEQPATDIANYLGLTADQYRNLKHRALVKLRERLC